MITAYGSIDLAVEAMKEGAYDFVPKPFKPSHIALVVEKALERQRLRREKEVLSEEVDKRYRLVAGNSAKFNAAISSAKKAAGSKSTILLLGEMGPAKSFRQGDSQLERKKRPALYCYQLRRSFKGTVGGANCLATKKAPLPARVSLREEVEIGNGGTSLSTKSAISPRSFR